MLWLEELRRLHDSALSVDWKECVDALNQRPSLGGQERFQLSFENLPPLWFNGDVESLTPGHWTLVVSLNHQLDPNPPHSATELWDRARFHNRVHWYPRFFSPLVRVACAALDESVPEDESEYATTRMVFVELCPYASRQFSLSPEQVAELAATDPGFEVAAKVRQLLLQEAEPALVLVNGSRSVESFESVAKDQLDGWRELVYASVDSEKRRLRQWHGLLLTSAGKIPVVGFPFLRTVRSHNSYTEIRQLGELARVFVREQA